MADSILWRRLDVPGHDACRLLRASEGWVLAGAAVFLENGEPAHLIYRATCDEEWRSRGADVRGWIGARSVDLVIHRDAKGQWNLNGQTIAGLSDCIDVDLAFTPATNLLPIRRLGLRVGESADVAAAWLDVNAATLEPLRQRYERRSAEAYAYVAGRFDYSNLLEVDAAGFVRRYPELWEGVS